jgi:hypothetical protein
LLVEAGVVEGRFASSFLSPAHPACSRGPMFSHHVCGVVLQQCGEQQDARLTTSSTPPSAHPCHTVEDASDSENRLAIFLATDTAVTFTGAPAAVIARPARCLRRPDVRFGSVLALHMTGGITRGVMTCQGDMTPMHVRPVLRNFSLLFAYSRVIFTLRISHTHTHTLRVIFSPCSQQHRIARLTV